MTTIRLINWAGALKSSKRDAYLKFAKWVDAEHGDGEQERLMRRMLARKSLPDIKSYMELAYWIVLMRGEEVLCVAEFHKGNSLTTLTTPKAHRGNGYASRLMKWMWKTLNDKGAYAQCPAEKRLLPLLERQGWTPADAKPNKDGTVDVMPEWVKPHYRVNGEIGTACRLNIARQMAFVEWLETQAGTKVPSV
jgi:GNAT superfamily N-acetyltransferase